MEFLQLLGMVDFNDPSVLKNGLVFLVGTLIHVVKKMWTEQVSLREYMTEHKGRTFLSLGTLMGVFSFISMNYPESSYVLYFMGGYCIDSLINKSPLSSKRVEKDLIV